MNAGEAEGLRGLTRHERTLLLACVLLGLVLRVVYQVGRPFVGDEVGTLESLELGYGHLLTHFQEQLTMNYYVVLLKALRSVLGGSEWVLTAPTLIAGVCAIPLVAALTLRFASRRTALVAALLVAVSPCLVEFSVRIRSYMLLVTLSLAAILVFYDWSARPSWRKGIACAVWAALALLAHPNALYPMLFVGLLFLAHVRTRRERLASVVVPMAMAAALVVGAYLPLWGEMSVFRDRWYDEPPTAWDYLPHTGRIFFVGGWAMWVSLFLIGAGFWSAAREVPRMGGLALGVLVPLAASSALGVSHYPWTYARFLMPILPLLLIFAAQGVTSLTRARPVLQGALLLLLLASWSPRVKVLFAEKEREPYAEAAAYLEAEGVRPRQVLCFDASTRSHLSALLEEEVLLPTKRWIEALPGRGRRIYVVFESGALELDPAQRAFGNIQVVTYGPQPRAEFLDALLADLERGLGQRVDPALVNAYEFLLETLASLGRDRDLVTYTMLYYECVMRGRRQRFAPPQLLESLTTGRHAGR